MRASTRLNASEQIYRLRQQINAEENPGKLRDLVFRLQIALNEEQRKSPAGVRMHAVENPFDSIIAK
jgi:hypothetical protein